MAKPGDVVTVDFPGVEGVKRRPAIVVSTETYHSTRPDVILGLLTTNLDSANAPTDYVLLDWQAAGLRNRSAFRAFLVTMPTASITVIGHLSQRDWEQVKKRLSNAVETK